MIESFLGAVKPVAELCAASLEIVGICLIALVAFTALVAAGAGFLRRRDNDAVYQLLRQRLGRGILLGLEFLVAADIIHTVAVELTFKTVSVLAIIVVIRTFLSFTMELELTGRWPWQGKER